MTSVHGEVSALAVAQRWDKPVTQQDALPKSEDLLR
ncbi:hypothetical protein V6N12_025542 [Hibiscus sabdariffa]|uniref:Uncharacterized protein n=1 Tax=Hibiscus sabdariffa TaxID=183260 RepID=A0ABR2CIS9_9ROSI